MILGLGSFASVTELGREEEHLKSNEQELLRSEVVFCIHPEEGLSGHCLKYGFVLENICVKRAHADLFPLSVRAVPAQYRCTVYSELLS